MQLVERGCIGLPGQLRCELLQLLGASPARHIGTDVLQLPCQLSEP